MKRGDKMKWEDIISKKRKGTRFPKVIRKDHTKYGFIGQKKSKGRYGEINQWGKIDKNKVIHLWKEDALKYAVK